MSVVGGAITKISAEVKKQVPTEGLNVNIDVTDVEEDKENLVVSYTYKILYVPDAAEMTVEGKVIAKEDASTRKKVVEEWKKTKILPSFFAEEVLTAMNYSASAVGTLLAFGLGVNAPINVPRARIAKPEGEAKKAS